MRGLLWDCLFIAGAATISIGVAFIHWPASIVTAGVFMVALSVMGARTEEEKPEPSEEAAVHQEDEQPWDS